MADPRRSAALLLAFGLLAGARAARANGPAAAGQPRPFSTGGDVATERPLLLSPGALALRLDLDYAKAPLRLDLEAGKGSLLLDHEVALRAGLGVGILRWLEAGLSIPVTFAEYSAAGRRAIAGDDGNPGAAGVATGRDLGAGDLRLFVKLGLLQQRVVRLGALLGASLPTGDGSAFRSDGEVVGEPHLLGEVEAAWFRLSLDLGARLHRDLVARTSNGSGAETVLRVGHELTYALALAFRLHRLVGLTAEIAGSEPFAGAARARERTTLLVGALTLAPTPSLTLRLGAGRSLVESARSEEIRVLLGLVWRPGAQSPANATAADRDHDGIPDAADSCPDQGEDRDGFDDHDGCPDLDDDRDGVPDLADRCPRQPEDRDRFEDDDGCPEADNDGDGIADEHDRCPDQAEPKDPYQDGDGCPNDDVDGDRIPNAADACPVAAETVNGIDDQDGCPEREEAPADPASLQTPQELVFPRQSAALEAAAAARLTEAAVLLGRRLDLRLAVEVFAERSERHADRLAGDRARAVLHLLTAGGVDGTRIDLVVTVVRPPRGRDDGRRVVWRFVQRAK